ncbi:competence/damage-inducible protein A [Laceyella putida]|uniref:Putative competence-damage inducible protein n=1 Tax=Laceyella putida TaxID=110101 RepID=A0ABW2RKQ9_9BACL
MRAEVITVGSELLLGETVDTHSAYLSRECFSLGVEVVFHTSVGDEQARLMETIERAHGRSQLVFLCGGLGPTLDDLTKETLSAFLRIPLIQDPVVVKHLERYFQGRSQNIPSNNYKQTYVFEGGVVFHNANGTAPGLAVSKEDVTYVLLPGPPRELIPMFEQQVRPFILATFSGGQAMVSEALSFFGIGESLLEETCKDLIQAYDNPIIATYAKEAGVTLRLTARAATELEARELIAPIKREVLKRAGDYCYSEQEEPLEEVVMRALIQHGKTIAVAESCTGGLLSHLFTSMAGSSQAFMGGVVSYSGFSKEKVVGVPEEVLKRYGTVSAQTAEALAEQVQTRFASDFALSVTGIAGPDEAEGKPVGLVFIGFKEASKPVRVYRLQLRGSRRRIQLQAAKQACFILQQRLKKGETTR